MERFVGEIIVGLRSKDKSKQIIDQNKTSK